MHIEHIFPACIISETPYGLKKRKAFNIADSAANLNNHNIILICSSGFYGLFYLISDMGDNLYSIAKVIAPSLFCNYIVVYFARSIVINNCCPYMCKSFIMPKVKVCFAAVISDIYLTVFKRA